MSYITVADVRAEGADASLSDSFIQNRIDVACRRIEDLTDRFFEPRDIASELDGTGSRTLPLQHPIISISTVAVSSEDPTENEPVDLDSIKVYNRHLSQGLLHPDDRDAPRITLKAIYDTRYSRRYFTWPRLSKNVLVSGTFGFTDPVSATALSANSEPYALTDGDTIDITVDGAATPTQVTFTPADFAVIGAAGADEVVRVLRTVPGIRVTNKSGQVEISSRRIGASSSLTITETTANSPVFAFPAGLISEPEGITPPPIQRAVMLLVVRDLNELADTDAFDLEGASPLVKRMETEMQEVEFSRSASGASSHVSMGAFTGIPSVDEIIAQYCRPPIVTTVGGVNSDLHPGYYGRRRWFY